MKTIRTSDPWEIAYLEKEGHIATMEGDTKVFSVEEDVVVPLPPSPAAPKKSAGKSPDDGKAAGNKKDGEKKKGK